MPRYLVTLTSDEFVDVGHFAHWLGKHEMAQPPLHGKDIFYTKASRPVKKGDFIVWMYKKSRDNNVYLLGYAGVRSSTQGLFFGLPGYDGKRRAYHGVIGIEPGTKLIKKVKISQKQFNETLKDTCSIKVNKALTLEQLTRNGAFIPEKEFKRLKGLLK